MLFHYYQTHVVEYEYSTLVLILDNNNYLIKALKLLYMLLILMYSLTLSVDRFLFTWLTCFKKKIPYSIGYIPEANRPFWLTRNLQLDYPV